MRRQVQTLGIVVVIFAGILLLRASILGRAAQVVAVAEVQPCVIAADDPASPGSILGRSPTHTKGASHDGATGRLHCPVG
jgi:hypothetical protein